MEKAASESDYLHDSEKLQDDKNDRFLDSLRSSNGEEKIASPLLMPPPKTKLLSYKNKKNLPKNPSTSIVKNNGGGKYVQNNSTMPPFTNKRCVASNSVQLKVANQDLVPDSTNPSSTNKQANGQTDEVMQLKKGVAETKKKIFTKPNDKLQSFGRLDSKYFEQKTRNLENVDITKLGRPLRASTPTQSVILAGNIDEMNSSSEYEVETPQESPNKEGRHVDSISTGSVFEDISDSDIELLPPVLKDIKAKEKEMRLGKTERKLNPVACRLYTPVPPSSSTKRANSSFCESWVRKNEDYSSALTTGERSASGESSTNTSTSSSLDLSSVSQINRNRTLGLVNNNNQGRGIAKSSSTDYSNTVFM